MKTFHKKVALGFFLLIGIVFILYYFGLAKYITIANIKSNAMYLKEQVKKNYLGSVVGFIVFSAALMMLTLPLTGPIAVCGGFLFGLWPGVLYSMIGVMIGIAISFLMVRYALSHVMRHKYGQQLVSFNERMREYGHTYLISLQLLTVVPYFIINTLAALANVPFHTFMWTTVIGSLPIVIIYAFAGRELYMIQTWGDILSVHMLLLLLVLAGLALLPMIMRKLRRTN